MTREEFKIAMFDLGANKTSYGSVLFIELDEGQIEYIYYEEDDILSVEVELGSKMFKKSFDIFGLHYKDQILARGLNLYGYVRFEQGATHKIDELKQILAI